MRGSKQNSGSNAIDTWSALAAANDLAYEWNEACTGNMSATDISSFEILHDLVWFH
jgi:hypothetical protein